MSSAEIPISPRSTASIPSATKVKHAVKNVTVRPGMIPICNLFADIKVGLARTTMMKTTRISTKETPKDKINMKKVNYTRNLG